LAAGDPGTSLGIACGIGWFWAMAGVIGSVEDCWQWLTASMALPQGASARRGRGPALPAQAAPPLGRGDALAHGAKQVQPGAGGAAATRGPTENRLSSTARRPATGRRGRSP